jgi:hypothetical protein
MAINIDGSKLPTFPNQQPTYYRGSAKQVRKGTPTPADTGYGQNGSLLPSSLTSVKATDGLSDLDTSAPGGDTVKDALVTGKGADVSHQTRTVGGNVPTNPGTSGASAGPKIPGALIDNAADPVRKPE